MRSEKEGSIIKKENKKSSSKNWGSKNSSKEKSKKSGFDKNKNSYKKDFKSGTEKKKSDQDEWEKKMDSFSRKNSDKKNKENFGDEKHSDGIKTFKSSKEFKGAKTTGGSKGNKKKESNSKKNMAAVESGTSKRKIHTTSDDRMGKILSFLSSELYVPMKEKELAIIMQVPSDQKELFHYLIKELEEDGKILRTKRGKIELNQSKSTAKEQQNLKEGELIGTFISNSRGFGFLEIEGEEEDYFISEDNTNGAFHLDTVKAIPINSRTGKRKEAQIIEILVHEITQIVGTFEKSTSFGFVVPDLTKLDKDIYVPLELSKGAVSGHKVVVEITDYGNQKKKPEGKVVEILGHANDPGVDILSIVKAFDIPTEFNEKVMNQAEKIPLELNEGDFSGRRDLREMEMVTIDGEDAKDLDDAVSLSITEKGFSLGVHIADVSNYVQENSALDWEALKRGTSVYLADRVIPMLPHRLSNGICSLNAKEDRLALSCIMNLDKEGNLLDYEILETVINVNMRLNYKEVSNLLELKAKDKKEHPYYVHHKMLSQMEKLAVLLKKKRHERGSLDFDFPETKLILDENGVPIELRPYDRNVATGIIEEFMLMANETVAQHYYWQEIPFLYRTHDKPDPEKIQKLNTFIRNFGYRMKTNNDQVHPKELQKLLAQIQDKPEEALLQRLALRSMKQAKYTTDNTGHFGLACEYYCHFTSPIRRYPDLQIHRIIKDSIRNRMNSGKIEHYREILEQVALKTSKLERRAEEAERETIKLKKVQYMEQHLGESFEGVISGVVSWGIYVELENTVEGLVRAAAMDGDYFEYDEQNYEMVGKRTGKTYKLGQAVKVKVKDTDRVLRTIDFALVTGEEQE